jgi:hypothetical protein
MIRASENQGPPLARLDWLLIAAAVAVACAGWAALRGGAEGNAVLLVAAQRQLLWLGLGGLVILLVQFFDYQKIARFTPLFYVLNLSALVAVLVLGSRIKGSRAWFDLGPFSFQPSETMKVVVAMALAQWFALRPEGQSSLRDLIVPAAIVGAPVALVLAQPDLGTALVFAAMFMGMLFWSGVPRKILIGMIASVLIVGAAGFPFMKAYQRDRILVFVNPERDPKGAGYNVIQSKVAVGAGGLTGAGMEEGHADDSPIPARASQRLHLCVVRGTVRAAGCVFHPRGLRDDRDAHRGGHHGGAGPLWFAAGCGIGDGVPHARAIQHVDDFGHGARHGIATAADELRWVVHAHDMPVAGAHHQRRVEEVPLRLTRGITPPARP